MIDPLRNGRGHLSVVAEPAIFSGMQFAEQILRAAPTIIYVYDVVQEKSIFQNRHLGELLGYGPPDVESALTEWQRYMHADDRERFPAHREKLKNAVPGEILSWEYRMLASSGAWKWFLSRDVLLTSKDDGKPRLIVGSASDITEQKQAERDKDLLANEMRHRVRNFSAILAAIARQSRPTSEHNAIAAYDALVSRLMALMETGNIVLSSQARVAPLDVVVKTAISPLLGEANTKRVSLDGPQVLINEQIAGGLALAMHELATNALKYGSLSVSAGSLAIGWAVGKHDGAARVNLRWKESGGPRVSAPATEGFGTRVLRRALHPDVNGKVVVDYAPDGLCCEFGFDAP